MKAGALPHQTEIRFAELLMLTDVDGVQVVCSCLAPPSGEVPGAFRRLSEEVQKIYQTLVVSNLGTPTDQKPTLRE
jgi:hypothetical protein